MDEERVLYRTVFQQKREVRARCSARSSLRHEVYFGNSSIRLTDVGAGLGATKKGKMAPNFS